jgi:multidrug efflux pump subunit AcrB
MQERFNLSILAVRNGSLTGFCFVLLLLAGGFAWMQLGRAEDPSFTLRSMVVKASWPGASATQMQQQVADPIESKLQELPWLDYVQSYSQPGQTVISVSLGDAARPADVPGLWYQVRKKLGDIREDFPDGVKGPYFDDEYSDVYSSLLALTGADNAELVRQAERIRMRLLRLSAVEKISLEGERPQEVTVAISHTRLATLGISLQTVRDALRQHNPVAPAGEVETGSTRLHLRLGDGLEGLEAIRQVPVAANGLSIRVGDIATISRGPANPASRLMRYDGQDAVMLALVKRRGTNVLSLGRELDAVLAEIRVTLPAGLVLSQVTDQAAVVEDSIDEFLLKFAVAIGVVLLISFLSLGIPAGIIVALSVPLTLSAVLVCLWIWGTELERISLGALILALGLLVDDAIIAIEAMKVKLEEGWDRVRAAGHAWTSTSGPMLCGTLVTVAGFIPVGFAQSSAGEYAGGIFWVIGAALIASWVVAVVFTPWLGVLLLKVRPGQHHTDPYGGRFYRLFRRIVSACVDTRWLVLAVALLFLVCGFVGMAKTRKQFFPASQRLELLVDVNLRQGSSLSATDAVMRDIESRLRPDPDASIFSTYVGAGAPRFFLTLAPDLPDASFGKLVIRTSNVATRDRLMARLRKLVAEGTWPGARVRVSVLTFGPPVGFPVQFRIYGPEPNALRAIADGLAQALRGVPGTRDVQPSWGELAPALRLRLDHARIAQLGLSPEEVAATLETMLSGATATHLREGTRQVAVVLRAPERERLELGALEGLSMPTPAGPVPLSQIARVETAMEEPILWRRNREGFIIVRADTAPGFEGRDVTTAALPAVREIQTGLPVGYRIVTGGSTEESGKANSSLFLLFPLMGTVMLVLLMLQQRHIGRVAMVVLTAPLGIPGAALALLLMDAPFGFVALLGVIALSGMVMRNTLILVDQVRQDLEAGHDLRRAIVESTVRRARPVVLTALAAILAFIPLTTSVFWGPMAVAMIGGLAVATATTLLVVPALYGLALGKAFRLSRVKLAPAE